MMKLHEVVSVALLAMATFAAPSHAQEGIQILGNIFRALVEQQRQQPVEPTAEPNSGQQASTESVKTIPSSTPANASAGAAQLTDWTPFFKSWERGCEETPEMSALVNGLRDKRIVLPPIYAKSTGKVAFRMDKGLHFYKLPLKGAYYGLPVAAFEYFEQPESDFRGLSLKLAASKQQVRSTLSRVKYVKVVDPDNGDFQALVILDGKHPGVSC